MSQVPQELRDEIPSFEKQGTQEEQGPINWSGLTSIQGARSFAEIATLIGLFAAIFFLVQGIVVWTDTPTYVFPKPVDVVKTFAQDFTSTEIHSLKVTAIEFLSGLAIGSTVGLVLAALLTLKPFA
jgi:NitT/TauT family transport system permease protein